MVISGALSFHKFAEVSLLRGTLSFPSAHYLKTLNHSRILSLPAEESRHSHTEPPRCWAFQLCTVYFHRVFAGCYDRGLAAVWSGCATHSGFARSSCFRCHATSYKAFLLGDIIVPIFVHLEAIAFTASGAPVAYLLPENEHVLTQEFVSLKSAQDAIVLLSKEAQLLESICEEHVFQTSASHVPLELINRQMTISQAQELAHAFTKLMACLHSKGSLLPEQTAHP